MPQDVTIFITDRNGVRHEVLAPTDMNMNIMELIRSYELAEEGTIGVCGGMAMCASCQCYVKSDTPLPEKSDEEEWEQLLKKTLGKGLKGNKNEKHSLFQMK